jgi:hypothetical protein
MRKVKNRLPPWTQSSANVSPRNADKMTYIPYFCLRGALPHTPPGYRPGPKAVLRGRCPLRNPRWGSAPDPGPWGGSAPSVRTIDHGGGVGTPPLVLFMGPNTNRGVPTHVGGGSSK